MSLKYCHIMYKINIIFKHYAYGNKGISSGISINSIKLLISSPSNNRTVD